MKNQRRLLILSLTLLIWHTFAVKYPVMVGGITGNTLIEGFSLNSANDLFIEAVSSDTALVNAADTNIALYMQSGSNTWLWGRELVTGEKLLQINFRLSDNARIALLYESSLLIVLKTSDGSVVRAQKSSSYTCSLGCTMEYATTTLNLIGVVQVSAQEYLGIASFNPDTSVSPNSIIGYQQSSNQLRYPTVELTDDARYIMSAQTSSQISLIFGFSSNFATLDFLSPVFASQTTRVRALHYRSTAQFKRAIGYLQHLSTPNQFTIFRLLIDSSTPSSYTYFQYQSASTTSIDYLDFQQTTTHIYYFLVHFITTHQVVIFNGFLDISVYYYTGTVVLQTTPLITFCPGFIQLPTPTYYIGGYDPAGGVFFQAWTGGSQTTSFVYSLQQSEMDVTLQTTSVIASQTSTNSTWGYLTSVVTTGQPTTSITISVMTQNIQDKNVKTPSISTSSPPSCLIQYTVASYPMAQDYFIGDTLTITMIPTAVTSCSGISCTYLVAMQNPASNLNININAGTNVMKFSTATTSRDETHEIVNLISIFPGSSFSPCGYYYQYLDLYIRTPQIVTVPISMIVYPLASGPMVVTLPTFTNNKGITGNPQLVIIYELYLSDGSPFNFGLVTNFNPSNLQMTIQTSDSTLPQLNYMKVVAYFKFNPANKVEVPFTIKLDKCIITTISAPTFNDMYYQLSLPSISQVLNTPAWSNLYGVDCEPFYFSAFFTATPAITFVNTGPSFSVSSSLSSDDGLYPVTLIAQLRQPVTNWVYASKILNFNIFIVDPLKSFILPKPITDITYTLNDTAINTVLPVFPTSKSYLTARYNITKADGFMVDPTLVLFNQTTRGLKIYSTDDSHVGVINLVVKAYFDPSVPYFVTSSFTLTVFHWCSRNLITAPIIQNVKYNIGDSALTITLPQWQMTMSQFCSVTYSVQQQTGTPLPSAIKYDSNYRGLTIFTSAAKDEKTYSLMVSATAPFFDSSSTLVSLFTVDIICITQQLRSKEADLSFNFVKGSSIPLSMPFKSFELVPKCTSSSDIIVYTATSKSGNLPQQIIFDSANQKFIVQDPDDLLKVGSFPIQVSGQLASKSNVKANLQITLNVKQSTDTKGEDIRLETVTLEVSAGLETPFIYVSEKFREATKRPYSILNLDSSMTFVKFLRMAQQLRIKPTKEDIGIYEVFLVSEQETSRKKIMQLVIIKVVQGNGQVKIIKIEGIIQSVGRSGLVTIDFNQRLVNINHTDQINQQSMALYITNQAGVSRESVNFTWQPVNFYQDQPSGSQNEDLFQGSRLLIRLNFSEPLSISMEVNYHLSKLSSYRSMTTQQQEYQTGLFSNQTSRVSPSNNDTR